MMWLDGIARKYKLHEIFIIPLYVGKKIGGGQGIIYIINDYFKK